MVFIFDLFLLSLKTNISNSIENDMVVVSITKKNSMNLSIIFPESILFLFCRKKKEGRLPHILSKKAQTLRGIK